MTKNKKPTLLLHSCCAPCFTSVFEQLKDEFDVTIFWFNPNIYPQEEYGKRLIEVERYAKIVGVKVINVENYQNESYSWNQLAKQYSNESEGGKRCELCIKYRLINTAKSAKENGFDYFATTLSVSPHKNTEMINRIGRKIENALSNNCHPALDAGSSDNDCHPELVSGSMSNISRFRIKSGMTDSSHSQPENYLAFLDRDFKKNNGYNRSIEICKEFNIYRQKYCGCIYSLKK